MKSSVAILAGAFFGVIGVLCAILVVAELARGEYLSAVVALGGAAFCFGLVIPLFKVVPGRVAPRVHFDGAGTTFRPDPGVDIPIQTAIGGAVVSSVLIVILQPMGKLAISIPAHMRYSLPFMAAIIAVAGAPMLWRNIMRGGTKYLRLTPAGFELAQGWRRQRGEWTSVQAVAAEAPHQQASTPGTIAVVMSDHAVYTLAAGSITPEGAAMRDVVRYYWQHPESREELTDGRAAQRLVDRERGTA
jgi:hypothetical protein